MLEEGLVSEEAGQSSGDPRGSIIRWSWDWDWDCKQEFGNIPYQEQPYTHVAEEHCPCMVPFEGLHNASFPLFLTFTSLPDILVTL